MRSMHGLPAVVFPGNAIRCLPVCPPGTRGRILSRRLDHSASVPPEPTSASPLDPSSETTPGGSVSPKHQPLLQDAAPMASQTDGTARLRRSPPSPDDPANAYYWMRRALDPALTGLTRITPRRCPPEVKKLLLSLDARNNRAIRDSFTQIRTRLLAHHLSTSDYSALLQSFRPEFFVTPRDREELNPRFEAFGLHKYEAGRRLLSMLEEIVKVMMTAGRAPGKFEYFHLLHCAGAAEQRETVREMWEQMVADNSGTSSPSYIDTWCYNAYMAGMAGTASIERRVPARPKVIALRLRKRPMDVASRASRIYMAMLEHGVSPNAMTHDIMMLAQGKLGNMEAVRMILRDTWGVDLEAPLEKPILRKDDPLHPTRHTLLAVAVAFGSNGEIAEAVGTVDLIAKVYKVSITTQTWVALLNWTYTYTRPHSFVRVAPMTRAQRGVPLNAVEMLWETMTRPPYNFRPTFEMHDYIVRSYLWRMMPDMAEKHIHAAMPLYRRLVRRRRETEDEYHSLLERASAHRANILVYKGRMRHFAALELRARSLIRRWVEMLVFGRTFDGNRNFTTRKRPALIEKWGAFLGREAVLLTEGGVVYMDLGAENAWTPMPVRSRFAPVLPLGTGAKEEDDF